MRKVSLLVATSIAAAALASATSANAAVTIDINQVGANVVAIANGTFNTTGLTPTSVGTVSALIAPGGIEFGGGGGVEGFAGLLGPVSIGTGGATYATTTSGDKFGFLGGFGLIVVPSGYAGGSLYSTDTFANATIQSLALTPGQYVYTAPNDTVTINIGGAVPEAGTWAMMLLGFGGIGFALRRRRANDQLVSHAAA